jgi:hypothetical protein
LAKTKTLSFWVAGIVVEQNASRSSKGSHHEGQDRQVREGSLQWYVFALRRQRLDRRHQVPGLQLI